MGPHEKGSRKLKAFRTALPRTLRVGFRKAGSIFERDMKLKLSGPGRSARKIRSRKTGKFRTTATTRRQFRRSGPAGGSYPGVVTGRLRSSVKAKVGGGPTGPSLRVGPNVDYAAYLELGTRHMQPYPFVGPTLEHKRDEAFNAIQREIAKPMDRN